ncbi:WXG100-like domain-containing protein [Mycolicibacterium sp. CBM1]
MAAVGDGLSTAVSTLTGAFNANTGQDASGVMFGRQYENTGRDLLKAVAAGIDACRKTGYGIQVSAVNYSRAEAVSDISGRAQPLPSPPCPAPVSAAGAPSAEGAGVAEPAMWKVVEFLVGDLWPNGSPAAMRTAAAAWRTFGASLYGVSGGMAGPYNAIGAQQMPESELIKAPIRDIGAVFATLGGSCQQLATQLDGFAADVEKTQNAIRELLHKLGSVGGIVGTFFEFFKGHGEDELHKIAADIKTVMNHLKNEAAAKRAGIQQAEQNVDSWVRDLEKAANREFTEFFGDHVGQVLSTAFNSSLDSTEGAFRWLVSNAEGIEDLNPLRFAYDPQGALDTWKGMADLANAVTNPASLAAMAQSDPQRFESMMKGLVRADEWSKDRPMLGASQNILDILTLPIAAGKAGEAGEIASAAARSGRTFDAGSGSVGVYRAMDQVGDVGRPGAMFGDVSKQTPQITQGLRDVDGKPGTVDPPAGGHPVSAPSSAEAPPAPIVKPVPDAAAVTRNGLAGGSPASTAASAEVHGAPDPVVRAPALTSTLRADPPAHLSSYEPLSQAPVPREAQRAVPSQPVDVLTGGGQAPVAHDHTLSSAEEPVDSPGRGASVVEKDGAQWESVGHDDATGEHANGSQDELADHTAGSGHMRDQVLNDQQRDEILSMDKGSRPDPAEYLPPAYIEEHLQRFDEGASRFTTADNLEAFGIGQRDGTTFVFPRSELDSLMESTGGDRSRLEQALGLPEGYFSTYAIVRVDIPDPCIYELRMPSGNEAGANDRWIPGGFLPEGMPEAVIDGARVPPGELIITDLSTNSE